MPILARSIPTRMGAQSLSTGKSMERATHGRGAVQPARSPIGEDRTPRGKCCASSSNTDTRPPTCDRVRTRFVAADDPIAEVAVSYSITSSSESRLSDIDPQPWDHNGHVGAADVTSSVITLKPASVQGPNEVTIATSVASRPRAMRIRPIRGLLWRASNVYQRSPR
jgi:hypothetical protein